MTTTRLVTLILALAALIIAAYAVLYVTGIVGPSLYTPLGRP